MHLFYTDPAGERVAISLGDWRDVREVRYAYLKGATPIVVEMLVGSDGEPLHKRKLAGHTTMRVDELFYDYYGTYGVYAPIHVGTIVTHPTYGE